MGCYEGEGSVWRECASDRDAVYLPFIFLHYRGIETAGKLCCVMLKEHHGRGTIKVVPEIDKRINK